MHLTGHIFRFSAILLLVLNGKAASQDLKNAPSEMMPSTISFNRDIRPILSDKCFHCHGPDEASRATELRLDTQEGAFANLGDYFAVVAHKPDQSELIARIQSDDEYELMPPPETGKPLTANEVQLLTRWVSEGAVWDAHWAYKSPKRGKLPEVRDSSWGNNWIDQMVLARLEKGGMDFPGSNPIHPSPPADRTTLIRRIYFDLIGLPPTPAQVKKFVADPSENAFETVVDELLASPHFGERMAIYWLDLVRFADTVGYHGDQDHNIAPYRDWVINAFNQNMPFDEFTRQQLAGDLLPEPTVQQKIASGYNRLLQTSHEGGLQPKEYTAIYQADRVRNVSMVWMGATVGCAQCHDHKYDPFTAKDFYSMAAFFADVDDEKHFRVGTNRLPTSRPPEILIFKDRKSKQSYERTKLELQAINRKWKQAKAKREAGASQNQNDTSLSCSPEESLEALDKEKKLLESKLRALEKQGSWTMVTQALQQPRVTRLLPRGNWLDETGPVVQPNVPEFLGPLELGRRANRLDLANWLVDGDSDSGKLTARVLANRLWYLLMGVGISQSLDDFGGQGKPPVYPELLDRLALQLIDTDWNLKALLKTIATSKTYRQSSESSDWLRLNDPYNQWFARQSKYRLPAEIIRDNALAISGLLESSSIGGQSVKPYQPAGYYQHLNFPKRAYQHDRDLKQWRRGVYVHWQRQFLHPTLKALDAPSREECTCERPRSNTPLAALALLNDPSFVEAAKHFAMRVLDESDDDFKTRLTWAFELSVSRSPTPSEVDVIESLYRQALSEFQSDQNAVNQISKIGDRAVDDPFDAELAAWTSVCRVLLNLDETITRN
ncbi:MAG: PSD1 and planctomycete cytochrome C domain-containing protein [Planctomycetota bacterium]